MKLLTLKLENFQGLKSEDFNFNGHSASIYGDNATGKTTVFNAMTWLLFGKASTGAKNFTPKTKGPDGDLHYLDHAAEATFKLQDGRVITLRKVFHEVYKKKRGSAAEEFDGHTIDFYIDGVPTKEKEYEATMLSLCGGSAENEDADHAELLPGRDELERQEKDPAGDLRDVSDEDVINSTPELKDLPQFILKPGTTNQYYDVEEYKKIASAKKTEINRQLQEIPGRIDEAQRAIPDITGLDPKAIDKRIQELNKQKSDLEMEKAQALSGILRRWSSKANIRSKHQAGGSQGSIRSQNKQPERRNLRSDQQPEERPDNSYKPNPGCKG